MVLHLAEQLEVPLRERNRMLLAAGYAPIYSQRPLERARAGQGRARPAADAATSRSRRSSSTARGTSSPPTRAIAMLTAGAAPHLLEPPINALRLTLHPEGMAPRIENLGQWRAHLLRDLEAQVDATGDDELAALLEELRALPGPRGRAGRARGLRPAAHRRALVPEHPDDVRHRGRRHRLRAGDRGVLPRRRDDRSGAVEMTLEQVEPIGPVAAVRRQPAVDLGQRRGIEPVPALLRVHRTRTSPASRSTRRCLETPGWLSPRSSTSSFTDRSRSRSRSRIRRRLRVASGRRRPPYAGSMTARAYSARR